MKKLSLLVLLTWCALPGAAQDYSGYIIDSVHVSTERMNPARAQDRFGLEPGTVFNHSSYEDAQDKLHNMRVFKELDFKLTPKKDNKLSIDIKGKDGYYVFPMAFVSGGQKSSAVFSLATGNLFKQGESAFLFAGGSKDGISVNTGLSIGDHFFNFSFSKLNVDQRFYTDHWTTNYGIFSTTDDKDEYNSDLASQVHLKRTELALLYAYSLNDNWTVYARPQLIRYWYNIDGLDDGLHNQVTTGVRFAHNVRKGGNMGALSGYGLTDKTKSLQNLSHAKYGYSADLFYANGGGWMGGDYNISKLSLYTQWTMELKQRHMLVLGLKAENSFQTPLGDEIKSITLLSGQGRYDRMRQGERGVGISGSFIFYLLRNDLGLLCIVPFVESAWVLTSGSYYNQSGAGATLSYKFWRFPLPIGLNYTRNLNYNSNTLSVAIGAAF